MTLVLLHCTRCHHEWEGTEGGRCDWCDSDSRVIERTTPLGRMMQEIFGGKEVSKRAIICPCGLATPCAKSGCQHSTAIGRRNKEIERVNSEVRVNKAIVALKVLEQHTDEWDRVMGEFCMGCGGPSGCCCQRDD